MADLSALLSEMDEEDIMYVQQSVQTIMSELESYDQSSLDATRLLQNEPESLTQNCYSLNKSNTTNLSLKEVQINNVGNSIIPSQMSLKPYFDQTRSLENISSEEVDKGHRKFLKIDYKDLQLGINKTHELSWIEPLATKDDLRASYRCARTEEFCKNKKLPRIRISRMRQLQQSSRLSNDLVTTPHGKNYNTVKHSISHNARRNQRRLNTAYESITGSSLLKLNELKFRKKKLRLEKSDIHGLGLFAAEHIPANDIVIEFCDMNCPTIANFREGKYMLPGIGSLCLIIDKEVIKDPTNHRNLSLYINHSCMPNSFAKLEMNIQKKVVIYSKRAINIGEEITCDYKMPLESDTPPTFCHAPHCKLRL